MRVSLGLGEPSLAAVHLTYWPGVGRVAEHLRSQIGAPGGTPGGGTSYLWLGFLPLGGVDPQGVGHGGAAGLSKVHVASSEPTPRSGLRGFLREDECRSCSPPQPSPEARRPAARQAAQLQHSCSAPLPPGPPGILWLGRGAVSSPGTAGRQGAGPGTSPFSSLG